MADSSPILTALRALAFLIACWNIRWSFRGVRELARGRVWPPSLYQSQIFWLSLAAASFGLARFFGGGELWRSCSFVLLIVSLALAAIGHHQATGMKARQFYSLFDHLEAALAIVALARLAPEQANQIAAECRRRTAAAMVARTDG